MKVHMCWGCPKATGWTATGYICGVYVEPQKLLWARQDKYCPFNLPKIVTQKEKVKKLNFLKASKRAAKGG